MAKGIEQFISFQEHQQSCFIYRKGVYVCANCKAISNASCLFSIDRVFQLAHSRSPCIYRFTASLGIKETAPHSPRPATILADSLLVFH